MPCGLSLKRHGAAAGLAQAPARKPEPTTALAGRARSNDLDLYVPPPQRSLVATPESWRHIPAKVHANPIWKVDEHVYAGPRPRTPEAIADLKALGVKTILSTEDFFSSRTWNGWMIGDARNKERRDARDAGLGFIQVPMSAVFPVSRSTVTRVLQTLADERLQPVYLHCRYGRERTTVLEALHKLSERSLSTEEAFEEMLQHRYRWYLTPILHAQFRGWSQIDIPANTQFQRLLKSTISAHTKPITAQEISLAAS